jgi:hypothetical protein
MKQRVISSSQFHHDMKDGEEKKENLPLCHSLLDQLGFRPYVANEFDFETQ